MPAALRARAIEIDYRVGPIPGAVADAIAVQLLAASQLIAEQNAAITTARAALDAVAKFQISEVLMKHDTRRADVCKEWVELKRAVRAALQTIKTPGSPGNAREAEK